MAKKIKIKAATVVTENNTPLSVLNTVISSDKGFIDHDTTYTASLPLSISGDNVISIDTTNLGSGSATYTAGNGISISNSTISLADTVMPDTTVVGPTANQQTSANNSIDVTVPQITVDKTGRVTGLVGRTIKITDTNTVSDGNSGGSYTAASPIYIDTNNSQIQLTKVPVSLGGTGETSLAQVTVGGASNAASVSGHTVETNVPAGAIFTDSHYTAMPGTAAISTNNVALTISENNAESGRVTITGSGATTVTRDNSGKIVISSTDNNDHYTATPTVVAGTVNQTAAIAIKENGVESGRVTLKAGQNVSITGGDNQITISAAAGSTPVTYTQGTGISINNNTISLADTVLGAVSSAGPTSNQTVTTNSSEITVNIPRLTVDKTGRVTSLETHTLTVKDTNTDNNTTYSAKSGGALTLSGTEFDMASIKAASNVGPTSNVNSTTFTVPYISTDKYGRVTATAERTITVPAASAAAMSGSGNTISLSDGGSGNVSIVSGDSNLSIGGGSSNQIKITNKAPHQTTNLSLAGTAASPTVSLSGGGAGSVTLVAGNNVNLNGASNKITIGAAGIDEALSIVTGSSADLNTYVEPGKYYVKNPYTNGPSGLSGTNWYGYLKVTAVGARVVHQELRYHNSSSATTPSGWDSTVSFVCERVLYLNTDGSLNTAGNWFIPNQPYFSSSAPGNKPPGRLWFDTTNNVLSVYDGSAWRNVSNP